MSQLIGPRTRQAIEKAESSDRESVLLVAQTHADEVCQRVWPGGTVRPDELQWTWNNRLRSSAGRFCPNGDDPERIELAWEYYELHGMLELLDVVRHELIHAWQYNHPDVGRAGHGQSFKQWVSDLDTSRHCKSW